MIDLHSHFLYGVDDGPATLTESMALLRQAAQAGITKILATPHVTDRTTPLDVRKIQNIFNEIKNSLAGQKIPVDIHLAAEVYYAPDMIRRLEHPWLLIGDKQTYILFDLPMHFIPIDISEIIFQLVRRKVIPIMAHPERNSAVQEDPDLLADWLRLGCIMQMDAGSISGEFGKTCQRISGQLIRNGYIHLLASDAHDDKVRSFQLLAKACARVKKKNGPDRAQLLCYDNPLRILNGQEVLQPARIDHRLRIPLLKKIARRIKTG